MRRTRERIGRGLLRTRWVCRVYPDTVSDERRVLLGSGKILRRDHGWTRNFLPISVGTAGDRQQLSRNQMSRPETRTEGIACSGYRLRPDPLRDSGMGRRARRSGSNNQTDWLCPGRPDLLARLGWYPRAFA